MWCWKAVGFKAWAMAAALVVAIFEKFSKCARLVNSIFGISFLLVFYSGIGRGIFESKEAF